MYVNCLIPEKYLGTTSSLFYEQLPMELQHVKEIIIRSDKNMKRSASEDSSSINNYDLDLTGLVESIGERILLRRFFFYARVVFYSNFNETRK